MSISSQLCQLISSSGVFTQHVPIMEQNQVLLSFLNISEVNNLIFFVVCVAFVLFRIPAIFLYCVFPSS